MDDYIEVDYGCDDQDFTVDNIKDSEAVKPIDNTALNDISVSCSTCCETKTEVTFNPCEDVKDAVIQNVLLKGDMRFLKVRVNLEKVSSGRKIALAVMIYENIDDNYQLKGMRACEFTVPGTPGNYACNVNVGEFCFVLPDEKVSDTRKFNVNVIAHYSSFSSSPCCFC